MSIFLMSRIRQDVPCPFKTVCRSKLLHGQLPAVLRLSARRLGLGIIHLLLLLLHGLSGVFHFGLCLPQLIVHFADAAFQFCTAPVELLALFQILLLHTTDTTAAYLAAPIGQ